jgi:hypothetical protein
MRHVRSVKIVTKAPGCYRVGGILVVDCGIPMNTCSTIQLLATSRCLHGVSVLVPVLAELLIYTSPFLPISIHHAMLH